MIQDPLLGFFVLITMLMFIVIWALQILGRKRDK